MSIIETLCFIGCCVCAVIAFYTLIKFTKCLNRCKRYISIAVKRLNSRDVRIYTGLQNQHDQETAYNATPTE